MLMRLKTFTCASILIPAICLLTAGCQGTDTKSTEDTPSYTVTEKNGSVEVIRSNSNTNGRTMVNVNNAPVGDPLVSLSATVKVTSFSAVGTEPNARVRGYFYNDGFLAGAIGSAVSDIIGLVAMSNSRAYYVIARCNDSSCTNSTTLFTSDMGTVHINEQHILYAAFDNTTKLFSFQLDSNAPVSVDPTSLAPVVTYPANNGRTSGFGVRISAASGQSGSITAVFDNFYRNQVLYDDFSDSALDSTKWKLFNEN